MENTRSTYVQRNQHFAEVHERLHFRSPQKQERVSRRRVVPQSDIQLPAIFDKFRQLLPAGLCV